MTTRTKERKEFLHCIFVTGLEGGIGYWSEAETYHWTNAKNDESALDHEDLDGFYSDIIEIGDGDEDAKHHIDIDVVSRGLNLILDGKIQLRDDIFASITLGNKENDAGYIDSDGADCIIQAGLLGEIRYG